MKDPAVSTTNPKSSIKLDAALVEKAVSALLKHHKDTVESSEKQQLLGTDVPVQVLLGLEVAPGHAKPKPIRLQIPHPLHKLSDDNSDDSNSFLEEPEVCLIVKEDSKAAVQEMIATFPEHLSCVKKVLGLQSLRNKHASYQQRRDLLARYTVFMADDRILPMLQSALGKDFVQAKKLPIPVRIIRKEALPFAIQKALSSTYLHIAKGTCLLIKAGTTSMPVQQLVENCVAAAEAAVPKVPRQWANIRSIAIKLPASQALPVYNQTPADLHEIAQMAGLPSAWRSLEEIQAEQEKEQRKQQQKDEKAAATTLNSSGKKSPLLRALKKQKKSESNDTAANDSAAATNKSKSEAKKQQESEKKQAKKKRKESEKETTVAATEQQPKLLKKSKKKTDDEASPAKKQKLTATKETFVAAKKFLGSKPGYVFKKDRQGLGYYLDVPPVPDQMALQALARMSQTSKRGGKKGKPRRGRR